MPARYVKRPGLAASPCRVTGQSAKRARQRIDLVRRTRPGPLHTPQRRARGGARDGIRAAPAVSAAVADGRGSAARLLPTHRTSSRSISPSRSRSAGFETLHRVDHGRRHFPVHENRAGDARMPGLYQRRIRHGVVEQLRISAPHASVDRTCRPCGAGRRATPGRRSPSSACFATTKLTAATWVLLRQSSLNGFSRPLYASARRSCDMAKAMVALRAMLKPMRVIAARRWSTRRRWD